MENNDSIPLELGDFEIIRQLGQGDMGVVYEAHQTSQNRRVALKTVSNGLGLTAKGIRRFRQEIEAASRLEHSNIVPIHSSGELGLVPYYAMQLVEGPSLDRVIRQLKVQQVAARRSPADHGTDMSGAECPDWALRFFLPSSPDPTESKATETSQQSPANPVPSSLAARLTRFEIIASKIADVADALAYAHAQGVLHRDLKPSNLLLSPDGRLSVSDFGLASSLELPGMNINGEFLGSPHHMSPEQVSYNLHSVNHQSVDHRTDIYALGVILYELLTLRQPFEGATRESAYAQIMHDEVVPPRKLNRGIPKDLQTICMKALEKDPDQRYLTAGQMAHDLRSFSNHHKITARRISWLRQSTRWCRRHWALNVATALALIVVGCIGVVVYRGILEAKIVASQSLMRGISKATLATMSGDKVAAQTKIEEAELLGAETWVSGMLQGQLSLFSGRPASAIEYLERALALNPQSLEIKTLLESAFSAVGRQQEALALQAVLWSAIPLKTEDKATTRDKLYLGSWISRYDPRRGLAMVEDANREAELAQSTLARPYLAQARWRVARDSGDPATAEKATREARMARELLRTNSFVWLIEFQALRVAEVAMRAAGRDVDAKRFQSQAQETLDIIDELFADSQAAACAWGWQAHFLDDAQLRMLAFDKAIEILQTRQVSIPHSLRQAYAIELYLQDSLPQARQELESLQSSGANFSEILCAILLAERDGKVEAAQEELSRLPAPLGVAALYRPLGLLMLGKPKEAQELYLQMRPSLDVPTYRDAWYQRLLNYCCGDVSAEEFVAEVTKSGPSNLARNEAHFFAAMHLLSDGRRHEAKQHFEKCIQAGIFMSREYQTSRAMLKKWETDPDWPIWIPKLDE